MLVFLRFVFLIFREPPLDDVDGDDDNVPCDVDDNSSDDADNGANDDDGTVDADDADDDVDNGPVADDGPVVTTNDDSLYKIVSFNEAKKPLTTSFA